jgi:Flp pilus assembly pilin Flp
VRRASFLRRLGRDQDGATIVEFALVLPVLCTLLLGTLDLGYRSYVTSVVQGSLHEAARMGTIGGVPTATIEQHVRDRLTSFMHGATVTINTRSYSEFSGVNVPETITQDTAPIGTYNTGDCYLDYNGNGHFDLNRGRDGTGQAEDVVFFEVNFTYPHIVPIGAFVPGFSNDVTVTQNTLLRNQPYAARSTAVVTRC